MRTIDADAAIESLDMICDAGGCLSPVTEAVRSFCKGLINHQPTIEAEPDKGWISVDDRLPEPNTWVLVFAKQGSYMNLRVDYITRDSIWLNSMCVTHWQPLPEPPKGE